jgi:hypothetical protein
MRDVIQGEKRMSKRILEMYVGEVEIESTQSENKVLRITRIADFNYVPQNARSTDKFVNNYLKLQVYSKPKASGSPSDSKHYIPLEKEIIFPLNKSVKPTDIPGVERVKFNSNGEVEELIHLLEEALETDPEKALDWNKLVSIPDWVWILKEDKCWWYEKGPEEEGTWIKYPEWVRQTGYKWAQIKWFWLKSFEKKEPK